MCCANMCFILNEITSQVILSATLLTSFIISPYCEHTSILFQYGCSLDMVCLIQRSCIPYIVWYIFLERTETCYLITEIFWHLILSSKKACTYMNIDFYWWWDVYDKVLFLYFRAPLLLSLLWIPFFYCVCGSCDLSCIILHLPNPGTPCLLGRIWRESYLIFFFSPEIR